MIIMITKRFELIKDTPTYYTTEVKKVYLFGVPILKITYINEYPS